MALFAQEWRKSQSSSFTEILPAQGALMEARVSADLSAMLGASALVSRGSNSVYVALLANMPFKREGLPMADAAGYAASLPYGLRNTWTEAVLSANGMNGSSATVATVSDTGRLAFSNDGPDDVATYYHPVDWMPQTVFVNITCAKSGATVNYFLVTQGVAGSGEVSYLVQYNGPDASVSRSHTTHLEDSLASLAITYPDGTALNFLSNISGSLAQNYTSVSYTKSPGALLVLPFGANSTRDYSHANASVQPGAGANSPSWLPGCRVGGCFSFGGSQYVSASAVPLGATANFAIMAWVKAGIPQGSGARLLYQLDTGTNRGLDWGLSPGRILNMSIYSTNASGAQRQDSLALDLSDGNWHMVALSANGSSFLSAYLDGAYASGVQMQDGLMGNSQPLFIGAKDASGSNGFHGMVEEVRFYNRSISAAEAANLASGIYQGKCSVGMSVSYNVSTANGSMLSAYNARLRIRHQLPGTVLSLPFGISVPAGEQGGITDYSPGLSGATGTDVAWIPDALFGGAYNFTLASSRISLPSQVLNGTGDFALSAWIRPHAFSPGTQQIMGNMQNGTTRGVLFYLSGTPPSLVLEVGSQSLRSDVLALPADAWTHVAAVRQNGQASLYVNGTLVENGTVSGDAGSAGAFSIGNAYPSSSFAGLIGEPEVFDRALSQGEIASLYSGATTVSDRQVPISQG